MSVKLVYETSNIGDAFSHQTYLTVFNMSNIGKMFTICQGRKFRTASTAREKTNLLNRKVNQLSNGKLAYVYVPNTSGAGFTSFNRYYFSQQDKKGVIIDERNNGGGSAADYMIDIMSREVVGYFNSKSESRRPWTTPMAGIWGPKVMIINERAGSGGDLLPYMFKEKNM